MRITSLRSIDINPPEGTPRNAGYEGMGLARSQPSIGINYGIQALHDTGTPTEPLQVLCRPRSVQTLGTTSGSTRLSESPDAWTGTRSSLSRSRLVTMTGQ